MEVDSKRDLLIAGIFNVVFLGLLAANLFGLKPLVMPVSQANTNNPAAYLRRGNRYLISDPGRAISWYNRALELEPDKPDRMTYSLKAIHTKQPLVTILRRKDSANE